MENDLFLRKCSLLLMPSPLDGTEDYIPPPLDLSEMHITFETRQEDEESPNNAKIRIHNLSPDIIKRIKGEYGRVVLQAGYQNSHFGVIFDGTIKQWGEGREANRLDTFLDILAADGDIAYNYSVVRQTLGAGSTRQQRLDAAITAMNPEGAKKGRVVVPDTGGILPRGRVLFGLARAALRGQTQNFGATWNISNGEINVTPLAEYRPGEVVVLNPQTGLIGRAEQTQDGVKARCLINPRINVGCVVKIDSASVNQISQQRRLAVPGAQLPYDKWAGIQMLADVSADGFYRVYVAEYRGDTRGKPWYMDLVLLSIDPSTGKVKSNG